MEGVWVSIRWYVHAVRGFPFAGKQSAKLRLLPIYTRELVQLPNALLSSPLLSFPIYVARRDLQLCVSNRIRALKAAASFWRRFAGSNRRCVCVNPCFKDIPVPRV